MRKKRRRPSTIRAANWTAIQEHCRFWSRVNKHGPIVRPELGPCWLWTGCKDRKGYGRFPKNLGGRRFLGRGAHQYAWVSSFGELPPGKVVCHRCDVSHCVRPSHLFAGTIADNNRDMWSKGRGVTPFSRRGSASSSSKYTEEVVLTLKKEYAIGGTTQRQLAIAHGMPLGTVQSILSGRNWSHLLP